MKIKRLKIGHGIYKDVKGRLPIYLTDWVDGMNYRVIPSTIFLYFINLLPAIAFAQDLFDKTDNTYGLNEILLSNAIGGIAFGIFAGQPLVIVGVTGPIAIFNITVYDLVKNKKDCAYFSFIGWTYIWGMIIHFIIAILDGVRFIRYITSYSCDTFGLFINCIYIQKGIEILIEQFEVNGFDVKEENYLANGFLSIVVSLLMVIIGVSINLIGNYSNYFSPKIRKLLVDYGTPFCVIFLSGFNHFGGHLKEVELQRLNTSRSFSPSDNILRNGWIIKFWEDISVSNIFLAIPFGILLTFLFYFDHNVSSLMCQGIQYPLKKPSSFHWDFFVLGITTGLSALLGIPAPNGLLPQAPLHTESLCVGEQDEDGKMLITEVVEQRVTNTAQGLLTLATISNPLLVVLGLVPQAVLAGLFLIMGLLGVGTNEVGRRIKYCVLEKRFRPPDSVFTKLSSLKWLHVFIGLELLAFAAEFGITQTKGAIAFPGVLCVFVLVPYCARWVFPPHDLRLLDGKAVNRFILQNLSSV
ncbi:Bor1p [Ascoidea rubescens DSM 1968]|uniref:Boron efflux transporter of the plasma membrane n=1 Tax=Ascoidea rubescens DSM 1968 TaxID=1344418 RepID=A0A1D2VFL1_9ASCO|nr:boron efflux transporter of the plasma membrane [Ascoidea rubescens DSM 1968]ODV60372.1 boron efflux transporter of the plasma membrane [Ascoidea rubescens DSM 1968]